MGKLCSLLCQILDFVLTGFFIFINFSRFQENETQRLEQVLTIYIKIIPR